MKKLDIDKTATNDWLQASRQGHVILMRAGRPVAVVTNVDGLDEEQVELGMSAEFWRMIEERRQQPTVPLEEVKRRLGMAKQTHRTADESQ